ncbi:hypothetical protein ACFX1Z_025955 [Malus domestica]
MRTPQPGAIAVVDSKGAHPHAPARGILGPRCDLRPQTGRIASGTAAAAATGGASWSGGTTATGGAPWSGGMTAAASAWGDAPAGGEAAGEGSRTIPSTNSGWSLRKRSSLCL